MGLAFLPHYFISLQLSTCGLGFPYSHCCLFVLAFLQLISLVTIFWAEPFCIQHHDALMSVLFDSPSVLREQGTLTSDLSHPGDIYHPNFCLGHPAHFDLSVKYNTESAIVSALLFLRLGWLLLLLVRKLKTISIWAL